MGDAGFSVPFILSWGEVNLSLRVLVLTYTFLPGTQPLAGVA